MKGLVLSINGSVTPFLDRVINSCILTSVHPNPSLETTDYNSFSELDNDTDLKEQCPTSSIMDR